MAPFLSTSNSSCLQVELYRTVIYFHSSGRVFLFEVRFSCAFSVFLFKKNELEQNRNKKVDRIVGVSRMFVESSIKGLSKEKFADQCFG